MNKRKPNANLEKIYSEQGGCCFYCKENTPFSFITQDHLVPKSKGRTLKDNSIFACYKCNTNKASKSLEEFMYATVAAIVNMLKQIVKNKFKASAKQVNKIKYHHRVMLSVRELINKEGKINEI